MSQRLIVAAPNFRRTQLSSLNCLRSIVARSIVGTPAILHIIQKTFKINFDIIIY